MSDQQPSLIGQHANYVAAAAKVRLATSPPTPISHLTLLQETVGSLVSTDMQNTGAQEKQDAISGMKAASEGRDPQASGFGKVEEVAGKAVGCEGMESEGAASKEQQ